MLSNQVLARTAVCGVALLLAAGCSMLASHEAATTSAPVPAPRVAAAVAPQQTAIEAALARGETVSSSSLPATGGTAGAIALNPNAPKQYTVKRGDTLWDISALFLRDPWLWPEIWHVNPSIANPHLIYPGDVLTLAYGADGAPQVSLQRGSAGSGGALRVEPLVRSTPIEGPIATVPYAAIASFLGKPMLISREQARHAPHVVALSDQHVAVGAPHAIYATGLGQSAPGRYAVVRIGQPLKDPQTGKLLGYLGVYTGTAQFDKPGRLSTGQLIDSARETQAGDLLLQEEMQSGTDLLPHVPQAGLNGQIVSVVDGVTLIGQYQVVAINRGSRDGLEPGHVLAIDRAGEVVHDATCATRGESWCFGNGPKVRLPNERTGTLLVFRTYEKLSYGLTVSVTAPVRIADRVRSP
jgi:LysM repeat protein